MKMMNKFCALMLSVALCAGMAAPAFAFEGEAAPVEQPVLPEVVEEGVVTVTDEETGALTPEGNLTLVDDYHTSYSDGSGQQFITLVSKSGNTFYLVIDRNAKGQQTVHFMNLVDEADLLTLMEEEEADAYTAEKEAAAQAEQDRLKAEEEAKKAVEAGYWPLYRYNPDLAKEGKNPFTLDSKPAKTDYKDFIMGEVRYASLKKLFPAVADQLFDRAEKEAENKYEYYKKLSELD